MGNEAPSKPSAVWNRLQTAAIGVLFMAVVALAGMVWRGTGADYDRRFGEIERRLAAFEAEVVALRNENLDLRSRYVRVETLVEESRRAQDGANAKMDRLLESVGALVRRRP